MKKFILLSILLSISCFSFSQVTFFHEDFELPSGADSVGSAGNPGWNIHTSLAYQGNQSMHSGIAQGDTSFLITNSFSILVPLM